VSGIYLDRRHRISYGEFRAQQEQRLAAAIVRLRSEVARLRDALASNDVHDDLPAPVAGPRPDTRRRWQGPNVQMLGGGVADRSALERQVQELQALLEQHGIGSD
jgi:hypothetical protein